MQTIADRITQRMAEVGITQADIVRKIGAGRSTVSNWVSGETKPSAEYIAKLAEALKCNSDWLVSGQPIQNQVNNQNGYIGGSVNQSVVNNYASQLTGGEDWLTIINNDMFPAFVIGDCVRIDAKQEAQAGNYVYVDCEGKKILRKYRPKGYDENGTPYTHLVAENDDYPVIDSRHQAFTVLGVVMEFKRKLV